MSCKGHTKWHGFYYYIGDFISLKTSKSSDMNNSKATTGNQRKKVVKAPSAGKSLRKMPDVVSNERRPTKLYDGLTDKGDQQEDSARNTFIQYY
jgi:hypothetical protein